MNSNLDAEIRETCGKCSGTGSVSWGVNVSGSVNGREVPKVCFDCDGRGYSVTTQRKINRREADRARRAAKAEAKAAEFVAKRAAERAEWDAANPGLADEILGYAERSTFMASMAEILYSGGALTKGQTEAAREAVAREAAKPEPVAVPEGRMAVEGVVLTLKWQESDFGGGWKMLVDCGAYRLWGTVPSKIVESVQVGDRVSFTATLKPGREIGFGFYSRPMKATVL